MGEVSEERRKKVFFSSFGLFFDSANTPNRAYFFAASFSSSLTDTACSARTAKRGWQKSNQNKV
jgi:hypothetical protein